MLLHFYNFKGNCFDEKGTYTPNKPNTWRQVQAHCRTLSLTWSIGGTLVNIKNWNLMLSEKFICTEMKNRRKNAIIKRNFRVEV